MIEHDGLSDGPRGVADGRDLASGSDGFDEAWVERAFKHGGTVRRWATRCSIVS